MIVLDPATTWGVLLLLFSLVVCGLFLHADYTEWNRRREARIRYAEARRRHPAGSAGLYLVKGDSDVA